jgi:hypothetical protein
LFYYPDNNSNPQFEKKKENKLCHKLITRMRSLTHDKYKKKKKKAKKKINSLKIISNKKII